MANLGFFLIALPLPSILAWVTLYFTNDSIITLLVTGFFGLLLPIYIYDEYVGDFSFERKIPDEIVNKEDKIKKGIIMGIAGAIGTVLVLSLWSMYMPDWLGPKSLTLQQPYNGSWYYGIPFAAVFLAFSALDHVFFNFFCSIEYTEKDGLMSMSGEQRSFGSNLLISIAHALMWFAIFWYVVSPILFVAIAYAGIALIVNLINMKIRRSDKMIVSTLWRIGLALGSLLFLCYLDLTLEGHLPRKTPDYYFTGHVNNCWSKWFSSSA